MGKEHLILPDGSEYKVRKDGYRRSRGNTSTLYEIDCSGCDHVLFVYQKDGPGPIKRCYLDRIAWASDEDLVVSPQQAVDGQFPGLFCDQCDQPIGTPMFYQPEDRPAYRMIPGSFHKRKFVSAQGKS